MVARNRTPSTTALPIRRATMRTNSIGTQSAHKGKRKRKGGRSRYVLCSCLWVTNILFITVWFEDEEYSIADTKKIVGIGKYLNICLGKNMWSKSQIFGTSLVRTLYTVKYHSLHSAVNWWDFWYFKKILTYIIIGMFYVKIMYCFSTPFNRYRIIRLCHIHITEYSTGYSVKFLTYM
jgi:hypothetical protein